MNIYNSKAAQIRLQFKSPVMRSSCIVCSVDNPAPDFPTFVAGLNNGMKLVRGGISWLAFMKCEVIFTDITDVTEWNAKITAGDIVIIKDCNLTASKATEATTTVVGSCRNTVVTDRNHTITIADISDNTDYDRFTFWEFMQENPNSYQVAYATCDDVLFPFNYVQINPNFNQDESTEGFSRWDVTVTHSKLKNDKPVILAGGAKVKDIIYP